MKKIVFAILLLSTIPFSSCSEKVTIYFKPMDGIISYNEENPCLSKISEFVEFKGKTFVYEVSFTKGSIPINHINSNELSDILYSLTPYENKIKFPAPCVGYYQTLQFYEDLNNLILFDFQAPLKEDKVVQYYILENAI